MPDLFASPAVLAALAALSIGVFAFIIFSIFAFGENRKQQRMASVTEGRGKKIAMRAAKETANYRRKAVAESLKEIDDKKKKDQTVSMRLRLERAGMDISPRTFWIMSVACGFVVGFVIFTSLPSSTLQIVAALIGVFTGIFGLPRWFLNKVTVRRQDKFLRELANSLDVIVRGVKSGLPLNECLQIVAREAPEPIASEFKEVVEQQRIGVPLPEALERMAQRMPLSEVRFFTIVIGIQQTSGGNLSEALGNLSDVLRDRIRMQMKVKALSAEAKASAMVLGALPPGVAIMLYIITPSYVEPLFYTTTGHFIMVIGAICKTIGVLVMRKMVNFSY